MQTFLPFWDADKVGTCLDTKRLGKQRVETLQLLRGLLGYSDGWVNHPASRMWRGYEVALADYGLCICEAWIIRGFNDTCYEKIVMIRPDTGLIMPPWWGDDRILQSHRSNLLRKDFRHYSQFNWDVPPTLPYHWPV